MPKGQWEAARALKHSFINCYACILLSQGIRNPTPTPVNHSISLFKNSSLAMAIGAAELTYTVKEIKILSFLASDIYFLGTMLYLAFSLVLMWLASWIQAKTACRVMPDLPARRQRVQLHNRQYDYHCTG